MSRLVSHRCLGALVGFMLTSPFVASAEEPMRLPLSRNGRASQPEGKLDPELIRRAIRQNLIDIKPCYERGLATNPELAGKLTLDFTVGTSGAVTAAVIQSSTLADPPMERCIVDAAKAWRFPPPEGGAIRFAYPFIFQTGSAPSLVKKR